MRCTQLAWLYKSNKVLILNPSKLLLPGVYYLRIEWLVLIIRLVNSHLHLSIKNICTLPWVVLRSQKVQKNIHKWSMCKFVVIYDINNVVVTSFFFTFIWEHLAELRDLDPLRVECTTYCSPVLSQCLSSLSENSTVEREKKRIFDIWKAVLCLLQLVVEEEFFSI